MRNYVEAVRPKEEDETQTEIALGDDVVESREVDAGERGRLAAQAYADALDGQKWQARKGWIGEELPARSKKAGEDEEYFSLATESQQEYVAYLRNSSRDDLVKEAKKLDRVLMNVKTDAIPVSGSIIKAARAWIREHPLGNAQTAIGEVEISEKTVKADFSHTNYLAKLATLPALKVVLEQGAYLGHLQDKDGKPITNHYFAGTVAVDGLDKIVFVRVREAQGASRPKHYVHEVYILSEIEESARVATDHGHIGEHGMNSHAFYKWIIGSFRGFVNQKGDLSEYYSLSENPTREEIEAEARRREAIREATGEPFERTRRKVKTKEEIDAENAAAHEAEMEKIERDMANHNKALTDYKSLRKIYEQAIAITKFALDNNFRKVSAGMLKHVHCTAAMRDLIAQRANLLLDIAYKQQENKGELNKSLSFEDLKR